MRGLVDSRLEIEKGLISTSVLEGGQEVIAFKVAK